MNASEVEICPHCAKAFKAEAKEAPKINKAHYGPPQYKRVKCKDCGWIDNENYRAGVELDTCENCGLQVPSAWGDCPGCEERQEKGLLEEIFG